MIAYWREIPLTNTLDILPNEVIAGLHVDDPNFDYTLCPFDTLILHDLSRGALWTSWQIENTSYIGDSLIYTPTVTDTTLTIYLFADGCGFDIDSISIDILPALEVEISAPLFICQNEKGNFGLLLDALPINSEDVDGVVWNMGNGDVLQDFDFFLYLPRSRKYIQLKLNCILTNISVNQKFFIRL